MAQKISPIALFRQPTHLTRNDGPVLCRGVALNCVAAGFDYSPHEITFPVRKHKVFEDLAGNTLSEFSQREPPPYAEHLDIARQSVSRRGQMMLA